MIISSLKKIIIKKHVEGVKTIHLNVSKEGPVTAGDIECPIKLFFNSGNLSSVSMGNNYGMLFTPFSLENGDTKFCIDSSTHLIEGYNNNNQKTGNLYNKYIKSGDFFLIPNDG